jgi:hypothetical protein
MGGLDLAMSKFKQPMAIKQVAICHLFQNIYIIITSIKYYN